MVNHKMIKSVLGSTNRSGFHHFVTPGPLAQPAAETGFDFLGGVTVVTLSAGMVFLMRLILAN